MEPRRDPLWRRIGLVFTRVLLAGVFAAAGVPKLGDPVGFAMAIDNYHVLPAQLTRLAAVALPVLELCLALALLIPRLWRGATAISLGLLLVFAAAMIQAMARDINLDCGCFGSSTELGVDWLSVTRNLALAALSAWSLWATRMPRTKPPAMLRAP